MNIGAHVRGGGNLIHSLDEGVAIGATSIQVFTQSPRMWKPSLYAPEVLAAFREAQARHPSVSDTFCHATYLINLATADLELYEKSVATLTHNLSVARGMGAGGLVLHVGSHLGAGFDDVVRQIADALTRALDGADAAPPGVADCPILIENAAGAGGTVGRSLEEIEFLIEACNGDDRLGLCIDTQHLWASGVDYSTIEGAEALVAEVDHRIGLARLRCLHLNDSKIELGGNRDRHANLDEGTIGTMGLAPLVGHPAIRDLPLLLEVPGDGGGPRARDVVAARHAVEVGLALYEGNPIPTAPILPPASAPSQKTPAKKTTAKKPPANKTTAKKTAAKKTAAKKATAKKTAAKKTPAKKATAKKTAAKKTAAKKTTAKKSTAKKTAAKKTTAKKTTERKSVATRIRSQGATKGAARARK
ncbi:MAG TPA: deoxyribonuclease IV [Acidimicrobiales bacterium]|nr:deoxyribonuclease IV [Acidimicrobiales bacterium]